MVHGGGHHHSSNGGNSSSHSSSFWDNNHHNNDYNSNSHFGSNSNSFQTPRNNANSSWWWNSNNNDDNTQQRGWWWETAASTPTPRSASRRSSPWNKDADNDSDDDMRLTGSVDEGDDNTVGGGLLNSQSCAMTCLAVGGILCCTSFPQEQYRPAARRTSATAADPCCPGLPLSILLFVLLFATSSMKQDWILNNGGESRRIPTRWMHRSVTITANGMGAHLPPAPADDPEIIPMAQIYNIPGGNCPPFTGPPIRHAPPPEIYTLGGDDYQYDYFYLNPGSQLRIDARALEGSFHVYLLAGSDVLDSLQHRDHDLDLAGVALAQAYITEGTMSSGSSLPPSYSVATLSIPPQRIRHPDVYTIWYENASGTRTGRIELQSDVTWTTYDLRGQTPTCTLSVAATASASSSSSSSSNHDNENTCTLPLARKMCLLVQTPLDPPPPGPDGPPPPPPPHEHPDHPPPHEDHPPPPPHPLLDGPAGSHDDPPPPLPHDDHPPPPPPHDDPPPLDGPDARDDHPPPPPPPPRPLEVEIHVRGHRTWLPLLAFSAIPLLFGILRAAFLRDARPRATAAANHANGRNNNNMNTAMPTEFPFAVATAVKSGTTSDESIPLVPAASVQTLPPKYTT